MRREEIPGCARPRHARFLPRFMHPFQHSNLANGIRVGTATLPDRAVMALGIWTPYGSRHESPEQSGVAHFLEHMVFKGTAKRGARRISLEIEGAGGEINAFTSEDHTCYHLTVPAGRFASAAGVLADVYSNPRLHPRDFRQEKQVILEEIQHYRENPGQHVEDLLSEALWPRHGLGRLITGTPETLAGITPGDVADWHRRSHGADTAVVAAAGPWPHTKVVELAERLLGGLPRNQAPPPTPVAPLRGPSFRLESRPLEQSHLAIGFRTPGRHHPLRHAIRLLSVMCGESMGSRLFQELRERRGLCYSVHTETEWFEDTGVFEIQTALDSDRIEEACRALARELARLREQPPTRRELDRAKEYALGQQALWIEATPHLMTWTGECLLQHGKVFPPEDAQARMLATTPEAVHRAARQLFTPTRTAVAAVGGELSRKHLAEWLGLGRSEGEAIQDGLGPPSSPTPRHRRP